MHMHNRAYIVYAIQISSDSCNKLRYLEIVNTGGDMQRGFSILERQK